MKIAVATFALVCLCVASANAQSAQGAKEGAVKLTGDAERQFSDVYSLDPGASTADIAKALAQANASLSDLAQRQCELLSAAFKRECRIVQINLGANLNGRRFANQMNDDNVVRRMANATMNLAVELSAPTEETKAAPSAK
jgi:hypothetical protein